MQYVIQAEKIDYYLTKLRNFPDKKNASAIFPFNTLNECIGFPIFAERYIKLLVSLCKCKHASV